MKSLLSALILFTALITNGQSKVFIGPQGGGQISSIYVGRTLLQAPFVDMDFISGYSGGVMAKVFTYRRKVSRINAGLQLGVTYTRKGWVQKFSTDEPPYHVKLGYIHFPAQAIVYMGKRKMKYFFTVGMFLEYLTAVKKDVEPNPDNLGGAEFYTYEDSRDSKLGFGTKASLGLQKTFDFGTIHLEAFNTFNVSNLFVPPSYDSGVPDISNQFVFGFTVAYLMEFGKLEFY